VRDGYAPIAYKSQALGTRLTRRPRQRLKARYPDATIIKVKVNGRVVTLALVTHEKKAEETLRLIERRRAKDGEIITYLMWLMQKNRGWARSFKYKRPQPTGQRGCDDDS
jgi:hypothetical protein